MRPDDSAPTPEPSRARRLGALALLPLAAVVFAASVVPAKEFTPTELASERATPTDTTLTCPGPLAAADVAREAAGTSDADLQASEAAESVGYRALSLEPDSNLLYGRTGVSETQVTESGEAKRPLVLALSTADGSPMSGTATAGEGDFSLLSDELLGQNLSVTSSSYDGAQPIMDVTQASVIEGGDFRSFALSRCVSLGVERTFVGLSTARGDTSTIILTNPSDRAARASLTVFTDEGVAARTAASEVVIAPGQSERVLVGALAEGKDDVAVRVSVDGSALAVHAEVTRREGLSPRGSEVIAPQASGLRHVIPGVRIEGGRQARVSILSDSATPATARVRAIGADGSSAGSEVTAENIASGATSSVETAGLGDGTYTLVVEADVPVAATASSIVVGADIEGATVSAPEDFASYVPAPAILNSSVLALAEGGEGGQLALHAERPASVEIVGVRADGTLTEPLVRELTEGGGALISARDLGVAPADLAGLVVVPDAPGIVSGAWTQVIAAGDSGPVISSVGLANNNVAAAGMDVRVRP